MIYVVTRNGTFGRLEREYVTESGLHMAVIRYGHGFHFWAPVLQTDLIRLQSTTEEAAARESYEVRFASRDP